MTDKVAIHRLATHVPGLDEVLGGGVPEFSFNLIAGQPGSGKTTLAHQIMFGLAGADRPALYITVLGEPPLKMLRYQQQFDFYDTNLAGQSIRYVNLTQDTVAGDLGRVLAHIEAEVQAHKPGLVFIDSFRSVVRDVHSNVDSNLSLQHFMQQLAMLMTSWQATTFLIGEYFTDVESNPVFTVADGLIWLHQRVERNSMVRQIEIKKMRGQASLPGLHAFRLTQSGFEVFSPPRVVLSASTQAASQTQAPRLKMGVPLLDEMFGGGLPAGHSLLIAGPSGSGKTVLAMAFLAEGARNGETGVIAAFEQAPRKLPSPEIVALIQAGQLGVVQGGALDLSVDEVLTLVLHQVRKLNASRVVIDSLSGLELAVAPSYRTDFRESLLAFVTTLKAAGVTVLLTSELEDRYTDLRFSPYDTAFLTDAIIVQRYIEVDSRLRRLMAVVKVRGSAHSDELREYSIGQDGIKIGEMLADREGLLGGRPSKKDI